MVHHIMKLFSNSSRKGGPDSSDYFQTQRQLKSIPPHLVKTALVLKKLASPASPTIRNTSTRPALSSSFQAVLRQQSEIDKTIKLFKQNTKQEMEQVLKEGNKDATKEADYKWRIVTSNIEHILREDNFLNSDELLDWVQQLVYGREEKRA